MASALPTLQRETLRRSLDSVDWSFAKRSKPHPIESVHPYPAKFIAELPEALLSLYRGVSPGIVLDPFCGGGTTLVAAQRLGLRSLGIDLNPIACLMARVKTRAMPTDLQDAAIELVETAKHARDPNIPAIPNLNHWFRPDVQDVLARLRTALAARSDLPTADCLRLAFSSIIVRVSNQDSDTRYAAVEKSIRGIDVYSLFLAAAQKLASALRCRTWQLSEASVINGDALAIGELDFGPVAAVVTSPPYPNAYEYWLYHKYRMWWLDFDPLAVKEREIGARAHFFGGRGDKAHHFRFQMHKVLTPIVQRLTPDAIVCFVVGRSRIHGEIVDNAATILDVGAELGLIPVARIEREIPSHRKSFNLSHANIKTESIVVLQNAC